MDNGRGQGTLPSDRRASMSASAQGNSTGAPLDRPLHPRVSINSLSSFRWSFDEELALSAELGVKWMGLLGMKLGDDPGSAFGRMRAAGIGISTVIGSSFDLCRPETWDATRTELCSLIESVAKYGGWSVYITPGKTTGARWADVLETFAAAVDPCAAFAREAGIRLAFEPSLRTDASFVNTLRDAVDVCARTGLETVVDFGNCWMERDFREVLERAAPHIALLQVSDCVISRSGISAMSQGPGRVPFFEGELPIERLMRDVKEVGYHGPVELEIPGPLGDAEGYDPVIRRGVRTLSEVMYDLEF